MQYFTILLPRIVDYHHTFPDTQAQVALCKAIWQQNIRGITWDSFMNMTITTDHPSTHDVATLQLDTTTNGSFILECTIFIAITKG